MPKADGPREIERLRRSILFPLNSQIYVSRGATGALLLVKWQECILICVCVCVHVCTSFPLINSCALFQDHDSIKKNCYLCLYVPWENNRDEIFEIIVKLNDCKPIYDNVCNDLRQSLIDFNENIQRLFMGHNRTQLSTVYTRDNIYLSCSSLLTYDSAKTDSEGKYLLNCQIY